MSTGRRRLATRSNVQPAEERLVLLGRLFTLHQRIRELEGVVGVMPEPTIS